MDVTISIHAPHTGRDEGPYVWSRAGVAFQSTRPIRGATPLAISARPYTPYFNPRAPYGARQPPEGRHDGQRYFNPRAPYGARPPYTGEGLQVGTISIHAPHTGRDAPETAGRLPLTPYFNPRAPYGARLRCLCLHQNLYRHFNPRAPYGARQQKCIIYVLHFCNNRQSKHKNQQETSSVRTFF